MPARSPPVDMAHRYLAPAYLVEVGVRLSRECTPLVETRQFWRISVPFAKIGEQIRSFFGRQMTNGHV